MLRDGRQFIFNGEPGKLLNNRVGTLLTTSERSNLSITSFKDITNGKLVVYQKRYEEFIWAIYNGKDESNPTS